MQVCISNLCSRLKYTTSSPRLRTLSAVQVGVLARHIRVLSVLKHQYIQAHPCTVNGAMSTMLYPAGTAQLGADYAHYVGMPIMT